MPNTWCIYQRSEKLHKSGSYMLEVWSKIAGPYADLETAKTWLRVSTNLDPSARLIIADHAPRSKRVVK